MFLLPISSYCSRWVGCYQLIVAVGALLTILPLAGTLGFVALPPSYWLLLGIMLLCYMISTQWVKTWFIRKFGE
jgi:Mg2+-importing ATPase